ncbi:MAG: hypothetical protein JRE88_14625 [Deltaproteobacteria bacterium]|jgi:hypothetical protein|nr:hypothetical protein [Deltaproteobacteria bacterium]
MKEKRNIHLKVQEMCDCYATTDPLKEMSKIKGDSDQSEAAEKWLALAALHGVNNNAKEICIRRSKNGKIKVTAQYRESELPSPGAEIGKKIMKALREITHIEGKKGKSPLALGIREDSIALKIKMKSKNKGERVTLTFPG